jgi:hypothetical protein
MLRIVIVKRSGILVIDFAPRAEAGDGMPRSRGDFACGRHAVSSDHDDGNSSRAWRAVDCVSGWAFQSRAPWATAVYRYADPSWVDHRRDLACAGACHHVPGAELTNGGR